MPTIGSRKKPISRHEVVRKNQAPDSGKHVLLESDGLLYEYSHDDDLFIANRLAKKMRAEIGWFEGITSHAPSVGSFYEALVETALREVLPGDLCVGTGFVYDSMRRRVSPQLDLIVYSNKKNSPIYQRSNFNILSARDVVSCVEIKKTLTSDVLKNVINKTLGENLGTSRLAVNGVQYINIFAFSSKISLKKIEEIIIEEIKEYVLNFKESIVEKQTIYYPIMQLTLPRVYLFDRTGYVNVHCKNSDKHCDISISTCRSSAGGHSLGEFIVSALSQDKNEQLFNHRNFLTFPLVDPVSTTLIKDVPIYTKVTMELLKVKYPREIEKIKSMGSDKERPYAALVSSGINFDKIKTLSDLEKTFGFQWLIH